MLELKGQRFGRLLVLRLDGLRKHFSWWHCQCDCGTIKSIRSTRLTSGTTKSCGCLRKELSRQKGIALAATFSVTHGATRGGKWSPEYMSWYAMTQRVTNKRHEHYRYYGGRGITICRRWRRFENFLADMGNRPKGKTLDRIKVNGNYEPGNCRWSTHAEQVANRRRTAR